MTKEATQAGRAKHNLIKGLRNTTFKIGDQHREIIKRESERRHTNGSKLIRDLVEGLEG